MSINREMEYGAIPQYTLQNRIQKLCFNLLLQMFPCAKYVYSAI